MKQIQIPYHKSHMTLKVEEERLQAVLIPKKYTASQSQDEIVAHSLQNPIGSPSLSELAKTAKKVLVITSDHTRPVPSKITMPHVLREIRKGNPEAEIKILIATGLHRPTTKEEIIKKFGEKIADEEEIINHDSRDSQNMVFKGTLPSKGELWLNSLVDWADFIVAEGFIEPHFFAGFSGGRKSILPGIAAEKTVLANHCAKFLSGGLAKAGRLEGNPVHLDMLFAAKQVNLRFILNVVIDGEKKIIGAFAGDVEQAHREGCSYLSEMARVKKVEGDIVITSNGGYPLDQNIYQAVKGMTAAEMCVKPGGVIIMVSGCGDGHGGEEFYKWFANAQSPAEVAEKIELIKQEDTICDQWEAQILARVLMRATVILVTDLCDPKMISDMHMLHANTLEKALELARSITGKDAELVVIPDGVGVIVEE